MSIESLTTQLEYTLGALKLNLEGIDHEQSLSPPQPAGNCLNWVAGHILANRAGLLALVGNEPVWDDAHAAPYKRGSEPLTDPQRATRMEQILELLEASQEAVLAGLSAMSTEDLRAQAPGRKEGQTVESTLALLVFHEAYHVGETAILRRLLGHDGAIR